MFWFEIPLAQLSELPAVVTLPGALDSVGDDLGDDTVRWLEPSSYRELEVLPSATLRWYERLSLEKKRGGWFVGVPHVLVWGPVSTAGLTPVDWSLPR